MFDLAREAAATPTATILALGTVVVAFSREGRAWAKLIYKRRKK